MIRKDLNSPSMYEADIGMSSLSCFINSDLTHDLPNDIMTRMTSTKPYIPFPRLKEKLEDSDSGVQAAAVNIICELARRNPKNYLALTPLKYLGLLSMSKILHTYPKSVQIHSDLIMCCLDDKDESIHLCALDLLSGMAILLENAYVVIHDSNSTTVSEVLYAAAWICSEFCSPSVILHILKTTL
ncbi:unnamed protein product [Rotaria sordida]|uniref:AP-3 complex subunit delta n=1 Tax=Rotaria sordida TaxID=392033 RepID=A0A815GQV4_9BILA|nr:unnamed protein product [Rotaria sordida]CAF1597274.1 unnamed protein product [Rotaria sordida]